MIDRNQLEQIKRVNQDPLNQVALELLNREAPARVSESGLHVLSLMRWGLEDAGISLPKANLDAVEEMLNKLERIKPQRVVDLLINPDNLPEQSNLDADELRRGSARDAATILLETLAQSLQPTARRVTRRPSF